MSDKPRNSPTLHLPPCHAGAIAGASAGANPHTPLGPPLAPASGVIARLQRPSSPLRTPPSTTRLPPPTGPPYGL